MSGKIFLSKIVQLFLISLLIMVIFSPVSSILAESKNPSESTSTSENKSEEKQENKLSAEYRIHLNLQKISPELSINLKLRNNHLENVVSDYKIPNVWDLKAITSVESSPEGKANVSLDSGNIRLDFSKSPLLPGQELSLQLKIKTAALRQFGKDERNNYLSHGSVAFQNNNLIHTKIESYEITYPVAWGEFDFINLKESVFKFVKPSEASNKSYLIQLTQVPRLEVLWGDSLSAIVKYEFELDFDSNQADSKYLKSIPAFSNQQDLVIDSYDQINNVYKDQSGNNFVEIASKKAANSSVNASEWSPRYSLNLEINYKNRNSLQVDNLFTEIKNQQFDHAIVALKDETGSDLKGIVSFVNEKYKVKPFKLEKGTFSFSESKLINDLMTENLELNYSEYALVVSLILEKHGIPNSIVLFDQRALGRGVELVLKTCVKTSEICRYYSLNPDGFDYETSQVPGVGFELASYDYINHLIMEKLALVNSFFPTDLEYQKYSEEKLDENLAINLQIPSEINNFENFEAIVNIDNNSFRPIFLSELVIENNSFPIIDNTLGGLQEGVIPGRKKVYHLKNVYIPKLFLGIEEQVQVGVTLNYDLGRVSNEFDSSHKVILKQNFVFLGLFFVLFASFGLAVYLVKQIYQNDKYNLQGAFWKIERMFKDIVWRIRHRRLN